MASKGTFCLGFAREALTGNWKRLTEQFLLLSAEFILSQDPTIEK